MYLWLWRHLPGGVTSKLVRTVILALAAAALLWFIVFRGSPRNCRSTG
jgi:hypothetical protein